MMNYTEILNIIKDVVMRLPAWRMVWISLTGLVALLICKPDILNVVAGLFK